MWTCTSGLVTDFQSWVDHNAMNFGWIIEGGGTARRFISRNDAQAETRPRLRVVYRLSYVPILCALWFYSEPGTKLVSIAR